MTTDLGRKYIAAKLTSARSLRELAAVWATVAVAYQNDARVFQLYRNIKEQMERTK